MPAPSFGDLFSTGASDLFSGGGGGGGFSSMFPYLLSAFGANALTPNAPSVPQLPYQGPAANNLYGDISGGLNNPYPTLQPLQWQQMLATLNNPNVSGYMGAANTAGQAATAAGGAANAGAGLLDQSSNALYQSSMDPQQALYDRLKQQTMDQSNVTNSMYGLANSPYGAGVANQNLNNFNIDWQNQQLNRQIQGANQMGRNLTGAADLRQGGIQDYLSGGQIPYSTYGSILGDTNNALNQYMTQAGAGNNATQQAISDWLQYLGMGQGAVGTNLAAYNAQQNANANTAAGLYPLFSSAFGGNSNPFSGSSSQPSSYWSDPNNPIYNPTSGSPTSYPQ